MLHGCVPVVVNDGVDQVFETLLDWEEFAVRIPEVSSADAWDLIPCTHFMLQTLPCMGIFLPLLQATLFGGQKPDTWHVHAERNGVFARDIAVNLALKASAAAKGGAACVAPVHVQGAPPCPSRVAVTRCCR